MRERENPIRVDAGILVQAWERMRYDGLEHKFVKNLVRMKIALLTA